MKRATTDATWKRVHGELVRLARSKGAYDAEEARWLLEGKRVLPVLAAALATNELCWSAVRELTRVATPETEAEWIAEARGKSMREVEDKVSGRRRGDLPTDPADAAAKRHVLRLEISGHALAAFREARKHIELEVGHSLDDDEAVRMLAHYALGGPGDPGRAVYQVAMTICERCGRGTRDGAGRELAVEDHEVEAALCDAQHIGCTHVDEPAAATQDIPPRVRRQVVRRAHGRCEVPGCRAAKHLEIHHIVPRAQGGTHDPSNLMLICSAHHMQIHDGALHVSGTAPDGLVLLRRHETWPAAPDRPGRPPQPTAAPRAPSRPTPCWRCVASASRPRRPARPSRRRPATPTSTLCCARRSRIFIRRCGLRAHPSVWRATDGNQAAVAPARRLTSRRDGARLTSSAARAGTPSLAARLSAFL